MFNFHTEHFPSPNELSPEEAVKVARRIKRNVMEEPAQRDRYLKDLKKYLESGKVSLEDLDLTNGDLETWEKELAQKEEVEGKRREIYFLRQDLVSVSKGILSKLRVSDEQRHIAQEIRKKLDEYNFSPREHIPELDTYKEEIRNIILGGNS